MTSTFDAASAVRRDGDDWAADVHPQWSIGGRPNGGYLLAIAARAAVGHLGEGDDGDVVQPLAVTGAFTSPASFGPVRVTTQVVRRGRTASVVRATVAGEAGVHLEALVTAGRLAPGEPVVPGPAAPDLPAETDCPRLPPVMPGGTPVPILGVLEQRLDPATLGFGLGKPSGAGELRGWLRMADGADVDALGLVMAVDCFPPAVFELREVDPGWVPTLQLSAFVRAVPAPGPLRVRTLARSVGAGMVDETTDVWDADGRLVAVGHQLAAVRTRPL